MRRLIMTLAAAVALFAAGSVMNRADAMGAGPAGIRAALDEIAITDQVHCVPGWLHHRWWNGRPHSSGCYRPRIYVGPRFYRVRPYFRGRPHFYVRRHFFRGGRHWR